MKLVRGLTAKDVDENAFHFGITNDNFKGLLDGLRSGTAGGHLLQRTYKEENGTYPPTSRKLAGLPP